jgi:hypothetical protein
MPVQRVKGPVPPVAVRVRLSLGGKPLPLTLSVWDEALVDSETLRVAALDTVSVAVARFVPSNAWIVCEPALV